MLCSDSISNEYLRNADQMLPDFVLLMGVLYGPTNCTRIVHLQHISHITCPEEDRLGHTAVLPLKVWMHSFKPLVHKTYHAMEQSGSVVGLCFGLSTFTKQILLKTDVPKEKKRLLRGLTGCSKWSYKTPCKVEGGYLSRNIKNNVIDANIFDLRENLCDCQQMAKRLSFSNVCRFASDSGQSIIPLSLKHGTLN